MSDRIALVERHGKSLFNGGDHVWSRRRLYEERTVRHVMRMIARLAGSDGRAPNVPHVRSEVERRRAGRTDANEDRLPFSRA